VPAQGRVRGIEWVFGDLWDGDSGETLSARDSSQFGRADLEIRQDVVVGVSALAVNGAKILERGETKPSLILRPKLRFQLLTNESHNFEVEVQTMRPKEPNAKTIVTGVRYWPTGKGP
jgi:hypothetical protein